MRVEAQTPKSKIQNQHSKLKAGYLLRLVFLPLLIFHFFSFFSFHFAQAQTDEELYRERWEQLEGNRAKQAELRQKIAAAQNQEQTLQNQAAYLENHIHLTELEIAETEGKIVFLQDQLNAVGASIQELQVKLGRLDDSINHLHEVLSARLRSSYAAIYSVYGSPITLFLGSQDFQDGVRKFAYLKALQQEDRDLIAQMQDTRGAYLAQQTQLGVLKREKEKLKAELEGQQALLKQQQVELIVQKEAKDHLLEITRNEEARFQQLLTEAQQEQAAIESAINEVLRKITGRVLPGTPVGRGEIIGIQGSTGKSTGDHLHFGYYPCGGWSCASDPISRLNDGSFVWPMDGYTISQGFGLTEFARSGFYGYDSSGNPIGHNGIDMYGPGGSAIKAAHDGEVYYTVDGWGGHGAIVRDSTGFITIYWHLQPKEM